MLCMAAPNTKVEAAVVDAVNLQVGAKTYQWKVYIAPITDPIILGLDFLSAKECIVDLRRDEFIIGDEKVEGMLKRNSQGEEYRISQVVVAQKTVFPPTSQRRATALMTHPVEGDFLVQPNSNSGLLVANALIHGTSKVPLQFCNLTSKHITLQKGHVIGSAVEVDGILSRQERVNVDQPEEHVDTLVLTDSSDTQARGRSKPALGSTVAPHDEPPVVRQLETMPVEDTNSGQPKEHVDTSV